MTSKKTIKKSKLIKLLSTFSTLEWKRFGRFVQSPYHNSNQHLIDLYSILKKAVPFENLKTLEQERIYKKIYDSELFKLTKFQNLCSDLYELAADFIIDVHLDKEKRKKKKLLIDALSERHYDLFKGENNKLMKDIDTQYYFLDEDDFLLLHQLNDQLWHHPEKDKYTQNKKELYASKQNLVNFYSALSTQLNAEVDSLANYVINKNEIEKEKNHQIIQLFKDATELHTTKGTKQYFDLKATILENWDRLKKKHKTDLLLHLINFSLTNVLLVKEFGHQELFTLYKIALKDNLFLFNGKLRDTEFLNISIIGFKLKKNDWTNKFIADYQQYLPHEISDFLIPLVYAYKALFAKNYEEVINLLSKINLVNNLGYLDKIKKLLLRAYFEGILKGKQEYQTLLYYELASMKKMMSRNQKRSIIKIDATYNFLTLTQKLLSLFINKKNDIKEFQELENLLNDTKPLASKFWLQEKFMEIKNAASI